MVRVIGCDDETSNSPEISGEQSKAFATQQKSLAEHPARKEGFDSTPSATTRVVRRCPRCHVDFRVGPRFGELPVARPP